MMMGCLEWQLFLASDGTYFSPLSLTSLTFPTRPPPLSPCQVDSDQGSSSESGMDSDDSEMGRRKARKPAFRSHHAQNKRPQPAAAAQARGGGQPAPGSLSLAQQQQLQQQQQQRMLQQQQQQQIGGQQGSYGGFAVGGGSMQQQAALLQQQQLAQQQHLQQLMAMLTPQEQQMVMQLPNQQRPQAIVHLVNQKRARQQQQQLGVAAMGVGGQQRPAGQWAGQQAGGPAPVGFVPNGTGAAGMVRPAGVPTYPQQQVPGMRPASLPQQGLGLQLPGMLGQQAQQQPSINPFTGGGWV
jgi:hypothetical protein